MVNYKCKICNYSTKNKSDYTKHNNTKKHFEKVLQYNNINNSDNSDNCDSPKLPETPQNSLHKSMEESYKCEFCDSIFSRFGNLTRHYKICTIKNQEIERLKLLVEQCKKEKKDQEKLLNLKLSQSEKERKHFEEESIYYKQMFKEAGSLVKKSVSVLTYVVEHYDNAPGIKMINWDDVKNTNGYDMAIDDILSYYKHKTLGKFLGDLIIKIYKKDNPKDQSIWNTDTSRLTYLIKEFMENKSSNWIVDKKGVKTTTYIIIPLLDYLKEMLIVYQENNVVVSKNNAEMEMMLENSKFLVELINDIDDGNLGREVLKYISTHLRFRDKLLE